MPYGQKIFSVMLFFTDMDALRAKDIFGYVVFTDVDALRAKDIFGYVVVLLMWMPYGQLSSLVRICNSYRSISCC